jgi:hypothetical protein
MADAGGAVSLALQIAQGLNVYYTQFRAFRDDVETVVLRTERLQIILRCLERPVQRLELDDEPISEQTWSCIAECLKAVKSLKQYQEKCSEVQHAPDQLRHTLLHAKNRLAYPFRKTTLEELQKVLDRLLANLELILHALQL